MQAKGDDRVGFLIVPLIFLLPSPPMRESSAAARPPTPSPPAAAGDDCRNFETRLFLSHIEILPKGSRKSCRLPQKLRGPALPVEGAAILSKLTPETLIEEKMLAV